MNHVKLANIACPYSPFLMSSTTSIAIPSIMWMKPRPRAIPMKIIGSLIGSKSMTDCRNLISGSNPMYSKISPTQPPTMAPARIVNMPPTSRILNRLLSPDTRRMRYSEIKIRSIPYTASVMQSPNITGKKNAKKPVGSYSLGCGML